MRYFFREEKNCNTHTAQQTKNKNKMKTESKNINCTIELHVNFFSILHDACTLNLYFEMNTACVCSLFDYIIHFDVYFFNIYRAIDGSYFSTFSPLDA